MQINAKCRGKSVGKLATALGEDRAKAEKDVVKRRHLFLLWDWGREGCLCHSRIRIPTAIFSIPCTTWYRTDPRFMQICIIIRTDSITASVIGLAPHSIALSYCSLHDGYASHADGAFLQYDMS